MLAWQAAQNETWLMWDADGAGGADAVALLRLAGNTAMGAGDLLVF